MTGWTVDPSLPLELLNGAGMVLETCFLSCMALYLFREVRRRQLSVRDWVFDLPPSMHLAVAIFVFDFGVCLRSAVIWIWRHFYKAGDFGLIQMSLLAYGGAIIVIGSLCKIRAITKPDFGNGPWLMSLAAMILFILATVTYR